MYGIQTTMNPYQICMLFENDVKMYGIQTNRIQYQPRIMFENDVKMYGIQTENGSKPFG